MHCVKHDHSPHHTLPVLCPAARERNERDDESGYHYRTKQRPHIDGREENEESLLSAAATAAAAAAGCVGACEREGKHRTE